MCLDVFGLFSSSPIYSVPRVPQLRTESYCELFLSVNQPVDQSNVTVKAKQPRAAQAVSPVPAPTRDFTLFLT